MNAQSILRDIRRNREVQLKEEMFLPTGLVSTEQHVQILLVDPPFKIDIVSLMKMWGDNYRKGNEKKITLFVVVKDQWVEAGKDDDEKKNRKNGIQSLIHSKILQTCNAYDAEMTVFEFVQYNGLYQVKKIISRLPDISKCTKKAYQVLYGSLVKYMATFMYGSYPRAKKGRFLKKGIRALELSEAAARRGC